MEILRLIDFLETDTLSVSFSSVGLKYLSLKSNKGEDLINLKKLDKASMQNPLVKLLIEESLIFLDTGSHNMKLDLTDLTGFQQTVLSAVGQIKAGDICTYKELAEIIGKPGAAQAVGTAVAKNPVSYLIPTHRVIPQKGLGICRSGAGFLREKLLSHEGHNLEKLRGNYVCNRGKCCGD